MKIVVMLIMVLLSANAIAKKINGIIVRNGDTLAVELLVPCNIVGEVSLARVYDKIKYRGKDNKKTTIYPESGIDIFFEDRGLDYHFKAKKGLDNSQNSMFWKRKKNEMGFMFVQFESPKIILFSAMVIQFHQGGPGANGIPMASSESKTFVDVFQIAGKEYYIPKGIGFRKNAMKYFINCKPLCALLKSRELRRYDVIEIAKYYSNNCN